MVDEDARALRRGCARVVTLVGLCVCVVLRTTTATMNARLTNGCIAHDNTDAGSGLTTSKSPLVRLAGIRPRVRVNVRLHPMRTPARSPAPRAKFCDAVSRVMRTRDDDDDLRDD